MSAPTWNDKFELTDVPHSVVNIQDYFEYFLNKHGENIDNPSIRIYVNKIKMKLHLKLKPDVIIIF